MRFVLCSIPRVTLQLYPECLGCSDLREIRNWWIPLALNKNEAGEPMADCGGGGEYCTIKAPFKE